MDLECYEEVRVDGFGVNDAGCERRGPWWSNLFGIF